MANGMGVNVNPAEIQRLMRRMGRKLGNEEQLIAYSLFAQSQDPIKKFISGKILNNLRAGATKSGREADIDIAKKRIESRSRMSEADRMALNLRSDISRETSRDVAGMREAGQAERQDIKLSEGLEKGQKAIDIEESEMFPKLALGAGKLAIDYGTAERKRKHAAEREALFRSDMDRRAAIDFDKKYGGVNGIFEQIRRNEPWEESG